MFKAFIFDLGGVVCSEGGDTVAKEVAATLGISERRYLKLVKKHMPYVVEGRLTLRGVYKRVIVDSGSGTTPDEALKAHLRAHKRGTKHDRKTINLIKKLRKKYVVVCLTNTEPEVVNLRGERYMFGLFDRAFVSTEMKLRKPNPDIYRKVIKELKVQPKEIVYIDDKAENVREGRLQGLTCIHYRGYGNLSTALKRRGISN
jgi:glucose-1-phosphatase